MSIKINRLEEGHNSYPLVCRRPAETVSLQRRQICYRWGTPAYWSLVPTLPHDKVKTRLKETIHKAFSHRNYGSKFVVLGYNSIYFSNTIQKGKTCYSEEQLFGLFRSILSRKPQKIEKVRRHATESSPHNPFNKKKHIKIGWKIKILCTFKWCEI
jgi:hypothetical protein